MIIYKYLYFHFYEIVYKLRKRTARESAIIFMSLIIVFLTLPFLIYILAAIMATPSKSIFLIFFLTYIIGVFWANKKYVEKKETLNNILKRFKNESKGQRVLGYILAIFTLLLSPIILFFLLGFLVG